MFFTEYLRVKTMTKTLEKILLKVNKEKTESVYFDILDFDKKELERFRKLATRIFKIEIDFLDVCSCVGIVELSRKIGSLYFIKYGRRYDKNNYWTIRH